MAFICTVTPETDIELTSSGNHCTATFPVGNDDEAGRLYSMVVALTPGGGGDLEFIFFLAEEEIETGVSHSIFESAVVSQLCSYDDRQLILNKFLSAAMSLLIKHTPERFYMCTFTPDLPAAALAKFETLTQIFKEWGYAVTEDPPKYGQRLWWMELDILSRVENRTPEDYDA